MTLVDTNVWLALAISGHVHHRAAQDWLETVTNHNSVLFCRSTQQSVLRLLTTSAVLRPYGVNALTNSEAWLAYEGFLRDHRITFVDEPKGLGELWRSVAAHPTSAPKLWMDAYLACFALTGGYQFVTTDSAFRQFVDLDLVLINAA
jgi:toxin-antitoxin system PIN domain toxin